MRKLTIYNHTHWQTKQLRSIALRALAMVLEPEQGQHIAIAFVYTRNQIGSSGCASLRSNRMRVRLPKHNRNRKDLAMVIAHEAAHAVLGFDHAQMRGNSYFHRVGLYDQLYAWADEMPLDVKPIKKTARPTADKKLLRAKAQLKNWERKHKLATTKIKIWSKKVKYYTKRADLVQLAEHLIGNEKVTGSRPVVGSCQDGS